MSSWNLLIHWMIREQTSAIEPKSVTESQFSSVMSYHEGDSTPLRDPSTDSQELSKSLDEESTEELASGTINQEDDSSHDDDVFVSDTEQSSSQSVQDDSSVQNSNIVPSAEENESENVISVEITEPRRSGRERKQTALYGNPLLYTITCKLTPRFVPVFFNKMNHCKLITGFPLFRNHKIPGFFKEFDTIFQVYFCIGS